MKYTLVIALEYQKYKKPGSISISVNNKFIDTFSLAKDYSTTTIKVPMIESKWYHALDKSHWLDPARWTTEVPKLFKVYEISEEHLFDNASGGGLLEIEVRNSHNDFTNGFMKNNSQIKFSLLALFPSHMSKNNGEMLMKTMVRFDNAYWKKMPDLPNKERKSGNRQIWPASFDFFVKRQNQVYEKDAVKDIHTWIGGDFTAEIPIKKKFKILYMQTLRWKTIGYWAWADLGLLIASSKQLLNIYNEDQ